MGLPGVDNTWDVKSHGRLKGHRMFAGLVRAVLGKGCVVGECKMRPDATAWKPYMTRIATFRKPLKGLCSL